MTTATDALLVERLSRPEPDEAACEAALDLCGDSSREAMIERIYPTLIRHKTLSVALGHVERAGIDLESISIPGRMFRSEWPFGVIFAGTREASLDRVSLGAIKRLAEEHEELLARLEDDLAAQGHPFILLFGRALRVAFPRYHHGMSHDVDIFVPRGGAVVPLLEYLCAGRGFAMLRASASRFQDHPVGHFKLFTMTSGHHVSLDMLCSGRPSKGLHPPFVPDLSTRARSVVRGDSVFSIPGPEDLLLMLAEKTHRRAEFIERHFNDAELIVSATGSDLDWPYLVRTARSHRLEAALYQLLGRAGRDVPAQVRARLAPRKTERSLLASMMATPYRSGSKTSPDPDATRASHFRAWQLHWFLRYLMQSLRSPGAATRSALDVARAAVVAKMTSSASRAASRRMKEFGPIGMVPLRAAFVVDHHARAIRMSRADGRSAG